MARPRTPQPKKIFLFQTIAGTALPSGSAAAAGCCKGKSMDSTYQRAMNASITPQIFSTMVSNAQKVAEAFAGSGSPSANEESIAAVFSRMVVAQIEMFEKK